MLWPVKLAGITRSLCWSLPPEIRPGEVDDLASPAAENRLDHYGPSFAYKQRAVVRHLDRGKGGGEVGRRLYLERLIPQSRG